MKQLEGVVIETCELKPTDLSLSMLKEVGAKRLVEMAKYFKGSPMIIVNGFIHSGVTGALEGVEDDSVENEATDDKRAWTQRRGARWGGWELHSVTFIQNFVVIYYLFTHVFNFSWWQRPQLFSDCFRFLISSALAVNIASHEISSPPWGRSLEYLWLLLTWQQTAPPPEKQQANRQQLSRFHHFLQPQCICPDCWLASFHNKKLLLHRTTKWIDKCGSHQP